MTASHCLVCIGKWGHWVPGRDSWSSTQRVCPVTLGGFLRTSGSCVPSLSGPVQFTTLFHFALICATCSDALNAPIGHLLCNSLRVLSLPLRSFGGSSLLSLLLRILGRVLSLLALSILVETLSLVSAWNIFLRKAFDHLGHWLFRNSPAYREKYAWHRDCQCGQMWVYMGSVLISLLKCVNYLILVYSWYHDHR